MVRVIFEYDEEILKWEPKVEGATDETEAVQAFNAVVITCGGLDQSLLSEAITEALTTIPPSWRIIPAV